MHMKKSILFGLLIAVLLGSLPAIFCKSNKGIVFDNIPDMIVYVTGTYDVSPPIEVIEDCVSREMRSETWGVGSWVRTSIIYEETHSVSITGHPKKLIWIEYKVSDGKIILLKVRDNPQKKFQFHM